MVYVLCILVSNSMFNDHFSYIFHIPVTLSGLGTKNNPFVFYGFSALSPNSESYSNFSGNEFFFCHVFYLPTEDYNVQKLYE